MDAQCISNTTRVCPKAKEKHFFLLIPLVHVVDQEETGYGVGRRLSVSSPLPWGVMDAYDVCGASMCPWDMGGGGLEPIGVLPSSLQ